MSQVSPHDRESEARTHRNGYALLAAALTVLASLALWGKQPPTSEANVDESAPLLQQGVTTPESWRPRIDALRKQATSGEAANDLVAKRQTAASSLADALEAVDLVAVDLEASRWPVRIDRLLRDAAPSRATNMNAAPTKASGQQARAEIEASIERATRDETEATNKAVDAAIAGVQEAREADLRAATLSVRDAQDQVEQLNTSIQRALSGLKDRQAQAARATALARDLAEVRSLLAPFITPGHFQPPSGGGHKYERTTDTQPVSLSRLQGAGALGPIEGGSDVPAPVWWEPDVAWQSPTPRVLPRLPGVRQPQERPQHAACSARSSPAPPARASARRSQAVVGIATAPKTPSQ